MLIKKSVTTEVTKKYELSEAELIKLCIRATVGESGYGKVSVEFDVYDGGVSRATVKKIEYNTDEEEGEESETLV